MIKIKNKQKLEYYIKAFKLDEIFETDMRKYMELCYFNKGEHVYRVDEDMKYLYFLVEGKVKVYTISKNGKALLLKFYNPLQILGDLEFIGQKSPACNVECLNNTFFIRISFYDIKKYANDDIKFFKCISKIFAQKLSASSNSSTINLLYPLEERLASYLVSLACNNEVSNEIKLLKLKDVAELLGSSYRHFIRTINNLEDKKIIKRNRNIIKILDKNKLENLAGDIYE